MAVNGGEEEIEKENNETESTSLHVVPENSDETNIALEEDRKEAKSQGNEEERIISEERRNDGEVDEEEDVEFLEMMGAGLSQLGYSAVGTHQVFLNLTLQHKELEDISFLEKYNHLQVIDFSHNKLKDLSVLKHLPYLISLNVSHNELTEVLSFTPPISIREMNFSHNKIVKIGDLSLHPALHTLLLDYNEIEEINGISSCKSLRNLSLTHNKIIRISGLDHLPIKQLDLSYNQIKKIENLQSLKYIQYINLSNNGIRSLRGLQNHGILEEINLQNNEVLDMSEIRYLRDLKMLRILTLTNNPIQETNDYRLSTVFKLSMLVELDGIQILPEEKVHANNFFNASDKLISSRDHMYNVMKFYQQPQTLLDSSLPTMEPYPILIITGPLGMQKKLLANKLCQEFPNYFGRSIGHTTRDTNNQSNEKDAYYYVSEDEFEKIRFKGEFIQSCMLYGYHYGISRQSIETVAQSGLACVMTMELVGVMGFKQTYYEPRYVLVVPKDIEEYKKALYESSQYTEPQINSSLESVNRYIETHKLNPGYFDAIIYTDGFTERYDQLKKTVLDYLGMSTPSQNAFPTFTSSNFSKKSIYDYYSFGSRGKIHASMSTLPNQSVHNVGKHASQKESKEVVVAMTPAKRSYERRYEETRSFISGEEPSLLFGCQLTNPETPSIPTVIPYVQGYADMTQLDPTPPRTANQNEDSDERNQLAVEILSDMSVESSELRLLDPLQSR